MAKVKFSSKIDESTLKKLRSYAKQNNRNISDVLSEAVSDHLDRVSVRPVFRNAADRVLQDNNELLKRLAK